MKKSRAGLANSSSRRTAKASARFQFDITIDKVLGTRPGNTYYIKWVRGAKLASTKHKEAIPLHTRTGLPFELEKLSLLVSLYRDADSKSFDEKDSKISLVAVNNATKAERTIAKAHFNLADFAGVPSASTTKAFKLSEKVTVKTLIEARFIKSGRSGPGSAGASSALSGMTGVSGRSSNDDDDDGDDFDDLNIDDVPEPEEQRPRSHSLLPSGSKRRSMRMSVDSNDRGVAESGSKRGIFGKDKTNNEGGLVMSRSKRIIAGLKPSRSKRGVGLDKSRSKRGVSDMETSRSKRGISDIQTSRSKRGVKSSGADMDISRSKRGISDMDTSRPKRGVSDGTTSTSARSKRVVSDQDTSMAESSPPKRGISALRSRTSTGKRTDDGDTNASEGDNTWIKKSARGAPGTDDVKFPQSKEMQRLKDDYDQQAIELRKANDRLRRAETTHQVELDALRDSLGTASGVVRGDEMNTVKLTSQIDDLEGENSRLKASLDVANREQENLRQKAADVDKLTRKNRDLTTQLDKAAVAAASRSDMAPGGDSAIAALEERLGRTRKEKELLENKIVAHKAHAEKVRDTYEKLSTMYSSVREENIQLQQDLEAARAAAAAAAEAADMAANERNSSSRSMGQDSAATKAKVAALEAQLAPLQAQVRSANARAQDADSAKVNSEAELSRLRSDVETLQMKLDKALGEARNAKRAEEELRVESGDLKQQRDAALKRALSKRGINLNRGDGVSATLSKIREEADREVAKARARTSELEEEIESLQEDVIYERNEKTKAREERDGLRDNVRGLERRTSEAALQQDSISAMRRKLSTQQMREEDLNSMVMELRREVKRLEGGGVATLVKTKLELAQAEDEKLNLKFEMKTMKKNERNIQERLAAHASSLEVKLGEAREKLETMKTNGPSSPVSDM